jgi:outer membrane receptor for ferrienterochelin and colicins
VPYPTGVTTAFTPAYSINQEGRRYWLSATVDF